MGQWSQLPTDLLISIDEFLGYRDKVRIRSVCTSWGSSLPDMPSHRGKQFPWLLRAFNDNNSNATHGFFDVFEKRFYNFHFAELQGKIFKGSSHGWILTVQDIPIGYSPTKSPIINTTDMFMINPFTADIIQLPPITTFPCMEEFVANREDEYAYRNKRGKIYYQNSEFVNRLDTTKLVMSPSNLVVAMFDNGMQLACCKSEDGKWKALKVPSVYIDIMFYKGKLYAVSSFGQLFVYEDILGDPIELVGRCRDGVFTPAHLVQGSDDLLIIQRVQEYELDGKVFRVENPEEFSRVTDEHRFVTVKFEVFKLDSNKSRWVEVKSIGDDILFVGIGDSICIPASEFTCLKGNRIYFSDSEYSCERAHQQETCTDIGVFDIENGRMEYSLEGFEAEVRLLWPPPLWITRPSSA